MKKILTLFVITLGFFLSACSGGSGDTEMQDNESMESTESTQSMDGRVIEVYGLDQMKFAVKEEAEGLQTGETVEVNGETYYLLEGINASAGEDITVELTTVSSLPASSMSHNFVLLNQGSDPKAFADAAMNAKDNDYIPTDMNDQIYAHAGLVGGGETSSVSFTAPEQTGDYDYLCSFPAHYSAGMRGTLTVE